MTWRPEIVVDRALAARLVRGQFPQFDHVDRLGEGWDYTAYRVDSDFVFRFPRREVVLPGMEREIATLPRLELPVAIPKPLFVGEPSSGYPWQFYGARYIPGRGRLNGIIDWVDVCRADPGIDLSLLWSFVPRDMFDSFLSEYGAVTEESLIVARVLALGLNATLANYARDVGNAALARAALEGVERAAAN
ncbi:MAG TPA: phosphotransferase [Candidatus Limnocylindrales bacterium]